MSKQIVKFLKTNYVLIGILLLASFMRLYKIEDYMTFLGDEGRDVLVVKHILEGQFTLLGPRASAGDFFLGPVYYYMMAPFLWLWNLNPVGPAIMVALLGVGTVWLIYYLGKKFFNVPAGLTAAALYAVSPLVIAYSHSSWNPNVVPFFTLLVLYLLYKTVKEPSWKLSVLVGILLGVIMQLHYLGTFVAVIIALFTLVGNIITAHKKWIFAIKNIVREYIGIFVGFLIGFSPFLLFEVRHGFPNTQTIARFIFRDTLEKNYQDSSFIQTVSDVFIRVFGRLLTDFPVMQDYHKYSDLSVTFWKIGILILAVVLLLALLRIKNTLLKAWLIIWIVVGILLFGLYKKSIYDYYFGFLFPVPFFLFGNFFSQLYNSKKLRFAGRTVALILFASLFIIGLLHNPFRQQPNRQKEQMKSISEFVLSKTGGKPFNFALLAEGNSDYAYRYFFEVHDRSPVTIENPFIDPKRKTVTDQLFVVCESSCNVIGNPLWEIAGFGSATVVAEWPVSVVRVYKLTHDIASESAH